MRRNKKLQRILLFGLFVLSIVFSLYLSSGQVFAAEADIQTKSDMTAVYECYKKNALRPSITPKSWEASGASALANGATTYIFDPDTNTLKGVSCASLMSSFAQSMPQKNASQTELDTFMPKLGYTVETEGVGQGVCAKYHFTNSSGTQSTASICAPGATGDDHKIGTGGLKVEVTGGNPIGLKLGTGSSINSKAIQLSCNTNNTLVMNCGGLGIGTTSFGYGQNTSLDTLATEIFDTIYKYNLPESQGGRGALSGSWSVVGTSAEITSNGGVTTYRLMDNHTNAGLIAINTLSGGAISTEAGLKLSTEQQGQLLRNALDNYYDISYFGGSEQTGCKSLSTTEQESAKQAGYTPVRMGISKTCYVAPTKHIGDSIKLFNPQTGMMDGTTQSTLNFTGVTDATTAYVAAMESIGGNPDMAIPPAPIGGDPSTGGDPGTSGGGSNTGGDSELPECTKVSGVLSWIVCPVLKFVGEAVGNIYEWVEQTFLMVPSSYMDRGNGVYQGWSDFRNFANILFAIAFAVVIFSQITGIGLSNYNIKKMLPRLIAVALLVNISFILCQLAVDLSNIVGFQVNKLLGTDLVNSLNSGSETSSGIFDMAGVKELTQNLVTGAGAVTGVVLGVSIATITWSLWLLPFFLACVSALIGIVFFFIILGVRQAGIIILVAIAPIAIVCYALPNTKSLFDKWWKMFSALLMVYPICGALMGGGVYAANLMISTNPDSFLFVLIAMLLTILPFFMVPTILNNSMKSMGALGAKISGFGAGLQKRSTDAIRKSGAYQGADEMIRAHRAVNSVRRHDALRSIPGRVAGGVNRMRQSNNALVRGVGGIAGAVGAAGSAVGQAVGGTAVGRAFGRVGHAVGNISQQNYARNNQIVRGQRNRQLWADAQTEAYAPGSRLYEADTTRAELARQTELIDNEEQIIRGQPTFNADDPASAMIGDEPMLDDMRETFAATMSTDENVAAAAQIRARAYVRALSETNKGRSAIYDALMGAARENGATLASMGGQTTGLSNLADYSMKQFGKAYKDNNFAAFDLMRDLQGKRYGHIGTIQEVDDNTRSLLPGRSYMSSHYDSAGLRGSYKPQNFAGADDAALNGAISALTPGSNNYITDAGARTEIANLSARSISSDLYRPKADDERQHQRIMISGYSAETMSEAGAKALHSIAQGMRDSNLEDTYKTQAVQKARAALEGHHYGSPEVATELNAILTAAGQQPVDLGRVDIGNMQEGDTSAPVQVRDTAPQPRIIQEATPAPQPAGGTRRRATSRPIITETPLQNGNVRTEVTTTGGTRFGGERRGSSPIILSDEALRNEDLNTWRNNRQNPPQNPPSNP